ncbi:MAG: HisA/HisF-related TIM barrel protein [Candidatus Aenigmatarchaeota archaeon]
MEVIPVMDLLSSTVVHAIRGERNKYRPIKSVLCPFSNPIQVAKAFKSIGFKKIYIADLDSIMGRGNNFKLYRKISEKIKLKIMVDAGIDNIEVAKDVFKNGASEIVVGTETLTNLDFLVDLIKSFGDDKIILSVDTKNGKVISKCRVLKGLKTIEVINKIIDYSVQKIIFLDLSRVGTGIGVNAILVSSILKNFPSIKLWVGGGIKDIEELEYLDRLGVTGVLLATSLHKGYITKEDLKKWL